MVKACGILPIAKKNNEIYILVGAESDTGKYCGFGGMKDKGESNLKCALREGYEETLGILGDKIELLNKIKNNIVKSIFINGCYIEYIIMIDYDKDICKEYKKKYDFCKQNRKTLGLNKCYFEKTQLKWFKLKTYKKHKDEFRECFLPLLEELTDYFDENIF